MRMTALEEHQQHLRNIKKKRDKTTERKQCSTKIKAKIKEEAERWEKIRAEGEEFLNRDVAMRTATEGLTTNELRALTPALLQAAIPMRDALKAVEPYISFTGHPGLLKQIQDALSLAKEGEKHG